MTPTQLRTNDPFYELDVLLAKEKILKLRKFVEKSSARDLSLSSVADHLGTTSKTLSRNLKADIPWTPALFFRLIKFKQAGVLLTTTPNSVAEICDQLGFDDEASFRKAFKRCTELTPTEYRRNYRMLTS